jgi:transposase
MKLQYTLSQALTKIVDLEHKLLTANAENERLRYRLREQDKRIAVLEAKIEELQHINNKQSVLINELSRRLGLDSTNSNFPPSSDKFGKKKRKVLNNRSNSDNKPGGQNGHKGTNLQFESNANKELDYKPSCCAECGNELSIFNYVETRQTHDILIQKEIINHHIYNSKCSCGCVTKANCDVATGVSYGNQFKSFMTYLSNYMLMPLDRLTELSGSIFNIALSEGSINNWQACFAKNLTNYEETVKSLLLKQDALHADESGIKINKLNMWLHVCCNPRFTYYDVHGSRGGKAFKEIGILEEYNGRLMHDCYKSYFTVATKAIHGLCNAHLLRELKAVVEYDKLAFAEGCYELLNKAHDDVKQAKSSGLSGLHKWSSEVYRKSWMSLLEKGQKQVAGITDEERRKQLLALLERLKIRYKEYFGFMYDFNLEFTNNQAERDIRMIKLRQKISGCFRNVDYAKHFVKIRGFISTMKKQGLDVLTSIKRIFINPNDFNIVLT